MQHPPASSLDRGKSNGPERHRESGVTGSDGSGDEIVGGLSENCHRYQQACTTVDYWYICMDHLGRILVGMRERPRLLVARVPSACQGSAYIFGSYPC